MMAVFGWIILLLICIVGTIAGLIIIRYGGAEFSPAKGSLIVVVLASIVLPWYLLLSVAPFTVSMGG